MGTRRLTLLRHGEAQPLDSCPEDFERVLTRRGTHEAAEMAARLVRRDLIPDLILTSPAERAWATASLVAQACELEPEQLCCVRELYLALPETLWRVLRQHGTAALGHVLICGHNPGLSQIAGRLGPKPQFRELPTAGLATAQWHAPWDALEPETAFETRFDDPETLAEDWL